MVPQHDIQQRLLVEEKSVVKFSLNQLIDSIPEHQLVTDRWMDGHCKVAYARLAQHCVVQQV